MKLSGFLKSKQSLLRYFLVGLSAFAVDYGLLLFLYYFMDLSLIISATAGYLFGLMVSFMINRLWVFGQKGSSRNPSRQLMEYIILLIFNYFFTLLALAILRYLGIEPSAGKIVIMGAIAGWNYLLFKKVIFAEDKPTS